MNISRLNVSEPFRMMEHKYSRMSYYEDYVIAREHGPRGNSECVAREGYDSCSHGEWNLDEYHPLSRRAYQEGVTMFVVFDYETKELVKRADTDEVMFYTSLNYAYEDSDVQDENDFNSKYLIFEVPEMKKNEVAVDVLRKPKTFANALKVKPNLSVEVSEDLPDVPLTTKWTTKHS